MHKNLVTSLNVISSLNKGGKRTNGLMIRKFKNIASLLLLMAFLLPSVIKLEHHHQYIDHLAKDEKHFHEFHEKCSICDFEFAVFLSSDEKIVLPKENPKDYYSNNYNSHYNYNITRYSFLLRAPPCVQI